MRASRIIATLILINVLLGVLAAGVVLSPEFAAVDAAVRKGKALSPPSPEVVRTVTSRPDWKRELLPRRPCGAFCRARSAVILRVFSEDELLRGWLATR